MATAMQSSLFTAQRASTVRSQRQQSRRGLAVVRASGEKKPTVSTPAPNYTSLAKVMAFSGPAPETVNGRLAMLGFVAAAAAEVSTGQGVLAQASQEPVAIGLAALFLAVASLFPLATADKRSLGPFTPSAEMLNGRAAMIGLVALAAIELSRGGAALL